MVVVVVGMEEEMKERMMVEFVVKMEGKWWRNGWPKEGEGGSLAAGRLQPVGWKMKKKKGNERERRSGVVL